MTDLVLLRGSFLRIIPAVPTTPSLMALAVSAGLVFATLIAAARLCRIAWLDWPGRRDVVVFRGTPLAIRMFLLYSGLAQFPAIRTSLFWPHLREPSWCAFLALTLNTAAYGSEIVRGGLLSVPFGQVEAARAAGMSRLLLLRRIVFPIALRQAIPGYRNEIILMVKAASLASMVTLVEVTGLAARIISETHRVFEAFLVAAAICLTINVLIARAVAALEWWLSPHLRGAPPPAQDLGLAH